MKRISRGQQKHMKGKRTMKLCKSITIILLVTLLLAACDTTNEPKTYESSSNDTTDVNTTETETEYPLAVTEADYEGEVFNSLCYTRSAPGTMKQNLDFAWSEDKFGEVLNDAIFNRNLRVEEDFNVSIEWTENDTVMTTAQNAILAGETAYSVVQVYINDAMTMGRAGSVWDLVPLLDLDAPWWDHALVEDAALGNRLYTITGNVTLGEEELNYCIYYNKTLIKQHNLTDPYTMVKEGTWTLDAMYSIAQGVSVDVNGDGVLDKNDAFGFGSDYNISAIFFYGAGGQLAKIAMDGSPELVLNTPQNIAIIETLTNIYCDTKTSIMVTNIGDDGWTVLDNMLMEDRLLFRPGCVYDINEYREMISDFGILPSPKFGEDQDEYCHVIASNLCPAISIPVTIAGDSLEHTATLLEALSYYSDTVIEAYYDVNLTTKLVRDEEAADMLDIIFSTHYYDLGKVFAWGSIENVVWNTVKAGGGFASTYASSESKIQTAMNETWEFYSE